MPRRQERVEPVLDLNREYWDEQGHKSLCLAWGDENMVESCACGPRPPVVVRHSEMADFRQCPLKWWFKWMGSWQTKEAGEASSLGTAWHEVMAHHYELLQKYQRAGRVLPVETLRGETELVIEYFKETSHYDQLIWMYDGYIQNYGVDPQWEILEFESTQTVEILPGIDYEWTTDVLVLDYQVNKQRVVDHKSTSNQLRKGDVDLSDQLGLYIKAQTLRGAPVADGIVSQSRTKRLVRPMTLDERYQRIASYRSPIELDNIWADARQVIRQILQYRETGEIPYSAPDPRVCSWKCDYIEPHLILRKTHPDKWAERVAPLLRTKGFEQKAVPRGSERIL